MYVINTWYDEEKDLTIVEIEGKGYKKRKEKKGNLLTHCSIWRVYIMEAELKEEIRWI